MSADWSSKLENEIAAAAKERDAREKRSSDDLADKERIQLQARSIWSVRKAELSVIVEKVDDMLKSQGYCGLSIAKYELKHSDIDRTFLLFGHTPHNRTKILLTAGRTGEFSCTISGTSGDLYTFALPMSELSTERLRECIADVVCACLKSEWAPRSESFRA